MNYTIQYNKVLCPLLVALVFLGTSCQHKEKTSKRAGARDIVSTTVQDKNGTATDSSLASKGTIVSVHDIPVYSMVSEVIKQKNVREGMRVSKGQVLFTLDPTMHNSDIEKTQRELEQAKFQYDNILVGQGYDISKPQSIPARIRDIARTRSSLNLQEQTLHQQRLMSSYYTILAPAGGVVTDVQAYQYDLAEKGKELCRIIDTDHLNVQFFILESELSKFQKGATVHFTTIAYPNIQYTATVFQISPKVDENGMVKIRATVLHDKNFGSLKVGMTAIVKK